MSIEFDPCVVHHFAAGVYAKQMTLPANHYAVKHVHSYDHMSILAQGRVSVDVEGEVQEYVAPSCIVVKAGQKHHIVAIEDSVWFCVHATEETDAERVDEVLIRS
jgi:quercetin dioxygenase-like cupin family protein